MPYHPAAVSASRNPIEVIHGAIVSDESAIQIFLDSFARKSPNTVRSYEKECWRFLLWLKAKRHDASPALLPGVDVQDINEYLAFLEQPRVFSENFLGAHGWKHQPFRKPLTATSIKHCITVLHKLFASLREIRTAGDEPYCKFNPVKLAHQGNGAAKAEDDIGQALTEVEWQAVLDAIEALPRDSDKERRHYHRARWIFQLLYRAYLRREEAAALGMSSFEASPEGWSIRLVGKGNKKAKIIATDKLMAELGVYRRSLGMTLHPCPGEDLPAILALGGKSGVTAQAIYLICKVIYGMAAQRMRVLGDTAAAVRLEQATPHWMRHTGVTHAMEAGVNPRYVQAQARHSSLSVTARYDHKERRAWREALEVV